MRDLFKSLTSASESKLIKNIGKYFYSDKKLS